MSNTRDLFGSGRFPTLYVYQTLSDIVDSKLSKCTTFPEEGHAGDVVLYVGDDFEKGIYIYTTEWTLIIGPENSGEEWIEH